MMIAVAIDTVLIPTRAPLRGGMHPYYAEGNHLVYTATEIDPLTAFIFRVWDFAPAVTFT